MGFARSLFPALFAECDCDERAAEAARKFHQYELSLSLADNRLDRAEQRHAADEREMAELRKQNACLSAALETERAVVRALNRAVSALRGRIF